jgi:DNA polymerase I-like protein with 3'-5' exonuclease and polymerase domains
MFGLGGYKGEMDEALLRAVNDAATWGAKNKKRALGARLQIGLFADTCPDPEAREAIFQLYHTKYPDDNESAKKASMGYAYALIPDDMLSVYNARDTIATGYLDALTWGRVCAEPHLRYVWDEITSRTSRSYAWMSAWGAPMDRAAIEELIWYSQTQQKALEPQLRVYCPPDLNLHSPQAVGKFIFSQKADGGSGGT